MISSLNRFSGLAAYLGQSTPSFRPVRGEAPIPHANTSDLGRALPFGTDGAEEDFTYSPYGPYQSTSSTLTAASTHGLSDYERAMPTRPGFSARALADAILDPAKQTISAGKTPTQVGHAARAAIDANLKKMADSGAPFDPKSKDDRDAYSAMGTLDRRALNAVANDVGGLFSKDEQQTARQFMNQQDAFAAGGPSAPLQVASKFGAPSPKVAAENAAAYVAWLDQASPDEKATIGWAFRRANAQDVASGAQGTSPMHITASADPRVALIAHAMQNRKPNTAVTAVHTLADLQTQS